MKYRNIFKCLLAGLSLAIVSCDLDEVNPSAGDNTLESFSAWKGLQAQCYSAVYDQLYTASDWMFASEGGTDEWVSKQNSNSQQQLLYYEGMTTSFNTTNKIFKQFYSMLTTCNTVINEAGNITMDRNEEAIKVLLAETKALLAFYYYQLVTNFGPITLVLESNASVSGTIDRYPKRSSEVDIYNQIFKDLTEAIIDLKDESFEGNKARLNKKAAMAILAKAYAQRAGLAEGHGLGDGQQYWQLAAKTAEDAIAAYGAECMYTDIYDTWADANNRKNKEAIWVAAGADGNDDAWQYLSKSNKLSAYSAANAGGCSEFWNKNHRPSDKGYFYGRQNSSTWMPTKYTYYCFDPTWDKRWETTFQYAYCEWSMSKPAWVPVKNAIITITQAMCDKYGIDESNVGKVIYPYVDCDAVPSTYAGNQFPAYIWPKGYLKSQAADGYKNIDHTVLQTSDQVGTRKCFAIPYPVDTDDDRFNIVAVHTDEEFQKYKDAKSQFFFFKISDLYAGEHDIPYGNINVDVPSESANCVNIGNGKTGAKNAYPQLHKFNWSFEGCSYAGNLQIKTGDMFIIRMAEVYLLAAEAEQKLGNGAKAAEYLNVLRQRAARPGVASSVWQMSTATEDDIFDEYIREMCGEFNRWALLKRHNAFEDRLQRYNYRAYVKFQKRDYNRPISNDFLSTILNGAEYGDNGYGATAESGLKDFGYDY